MKFGLLGLGWKTINVVWVRVRVENYKRGMASLCVLTSFNYD